MKDNNNDRVGFRNIVSSLDHSIRKTVPTYCQPDSGGVRWEIGMSHCTNFVLSADSRFSLNWFSSSLL